MSLHFLLEWGGINYAGDIKEFTGISSPYEAPENAELNIQTTVWSLTFPNGSK